MSDDLSKQVEELRQHMESQPRPVINSDGLRDLLQISADEFEEVTVNADTDRMARLAEAEGKPELARLIRGNVTPQELAEEGMQKALVEYAQELGGVIVDSHYDGTREDLTPEAAERAALERALGQNLQAAPPQLQPIERRIEALLAKLEQRMQTVEEEVLFTSSANRFAHLRSGIEAKSNVTIPHLPPAPDWNTLEAYVEPFLRDIVDHIQGAPILRERATIAGMVPFDVLKGVDIVGEELLRIVGERGRAYGEEAILAMGEAGMIGMIMSKVMRLMWSHRAGLQFQARRDSYIDLAGYCLLCVALDQFVMENSIAVQGQREEERSQSPEQDKAGE